jgi:hypothetical protein
MRTIGMTIDKHHFSSILLSSCLSSIRADSRYSRAVDFFSFASFCVFRGWISFFEPNAAGLDIQPVVWGGA